MKFIKCGVTALTVLCLSLFIGSAALAAEFSDTAGHWAETAIDEWSGYGVIAGSNGLFRPNDIITRAEFFAILQQIIVYPPSGEAPVVFADVTESDWFYGIFQSLIAAGMVEPIEGFVDPNRPLTRQEEAFFLAKAFNIPPVADETAFADDGDIGAWSKGYVKALNELGIIKGYETEEGQMFRPSNSITRAEAVVIIELVAQNLINAPGEYSDNVEGALVINCSGVKLTGMTVSGDLYLTGGAADTILDNVSISGELIVLNAGS